jgi:hypothetical protein
MGATMVSSNTEHQRGYGTQWTGNPSRQPFPQKNNPMKVTLRKLTLAWPLVIFLLLAALAHAETAVQGWVQRYNGPGNGDDQATAIAVDGSNNVIVTGYSFDSGGVNSVYTTIKYSSTGVPLWTNRYDGLGNGEIQARAVAVDGNNDVIVTGAKLCSRGNSDYATLKYSSAGLPLWTNRFTGPARDNGEVWAVVADSSNDVIVAGDSATIKYSSAGVPLWTNWCDGAAQTYAAAMDGSNNVIVVELDVYDERFVYATIKYSSAGVPLWTNLYNGPGNAGAVPSALAVDRSNNVIVTGTSYKTSEQASLDYATIKYSSAGVPLWTNCYDGPVNSDDESVGVVVDSSNDVIVAGCSASMALYPFNNDYATIKYSSAGVPLWTNRYNGPRNGYDSLYSLAVDARNNVIVTGDSDGDLSSYNVDYATIKYSSAGVPLWTNRYIGPSISVGVARAVVVDRGGNVIVTGWSASGGVDSSWDYATVKYICVPSPMVTGLQRTNGMFQMRVDDVLQPGTLVIEASTNLSTTNWAPVFTNTMPTNVLFYTDPDASNTPARFYRAFQFP